MTLCITLGMQDAFASLSSLKTTNKTRELIADKLFCARHRVRPEDFTRRRQLRFMMTVVFLLQKTVRSIQTHLHSFFEALGQETEAVSPSAWSQARLKLRYTAFIELNEEAVLKTIYHEKGSFEVRRWRGFRLTAIDSSLVRLPNEEKLGQEFGWVDCSNESGSCGHYPQARLSVLTDVLNRIAIETLFVPWEQSERQLAMAHIKSMQPDDLALLDRGYASYELYACFIKAERHFVCRCSKQSFKAVNQLFKLNQAGVSICVPLRPDAHAAAQIRQQGLPLEITISLVTVRLSTGELEVLATDLLDRSLYPTELFGELYHQRWGVETYYGVLKGRLDLENFSGLSAEAIRQDVYSTVFLSNLESIFTRPANDQLQEHSRNLKYRQQVNQAVCFHTVKSQIVALLLSREPIGPVLQKMQQLFLDNSTTIRPERKVPRRKPSAYRSYHYQRNVRKAVF